MDRKALVVVVASAAAVLAAFVAFFVVRGAGRQQGTASTAQPASAGLAERKPPAYPPLPPSTAGPTPRAAARDALLEELALMNDLRQLRGSDPALTLRLAREGNERFKDSPGRAERSWFIVKALSDLGRHDEARLEGRVLVDKYRETRWAQDVYRHLFVNPSTHPFERGYGKTLESDP